MSRFNQPLRPTAAELESEAFKRGYQIGVELGHIAVEDVGDLTKGFNLGVHSRYTVEELVQVYKLIDK